MRFAAALPGVTVVAMAWSTLSPLPLLPRVAETCHDCIGMIYGRQRISQAMAIG
jgi:hypothetical protein